MEEKHGHRAAHSINPHLRPPPCLTESMLRQMPPVGSGLLVRFMFKAGKQFPKECRETRIDIDRKRQKVFREW